MGKFKYTSAPNDAKKNTVVAHKLVQKKALVGKPKCRSVQNDAEKNAPVARKLVQKKGMVITFHAHTVSFTEGVFIEQTVSHVLRTLSQESDAYRKSREGDGEISTTLDVLPQMNGVYLSNEYYSNWPPYVTNDPAKFFTRMAPCDHVDLAQYLRC